MRKILVICAHPDDETLGLGGTLALYSKKSEISVLTFADGQFGRDKSSKGIQQRREQGEKACSILGVTNTKFLTYIDQKLDTIPLVELASQIETVMHTWKPEIVFTHYWGDVNQDHRRLYEATLIATRPTPGSTVKNVICYETPSSSEWGNNKDRFSPNLFVDVDLTMKKKIEALKQYKFEINKYPHPRSIQSIKNRAQYWGSSIGKKNVEAFVIVRSIEDTI